MNVAQTSMDSDLPPNARVPLRLPTGEVHIWRARLDLDPFELARISRSLSADEHARASRFHFDRDRNHFVAARAILRDILSRYLGCDPLEIKLTSGSHDKPELAGPARRRPRFNLSHSAGVAIYAVALDREVGIDIERVRVDVDYFDLAEKFFAAGEIRRLHHLAPDQRVSGFFNCWTRKEAYIKARGLGLSIALDSFEVSLAPAEPAAVLFETRDILTGAIGGTLPRLSLIDLGDGLGFAAALAVEGDVPVLRALNWENP